MEEKEIEGLDANLLKEESDDETESTDSIDEVCRFSAKLAGVISPTMTVEL